jgi:Fur family peroxide stress response transcriptional regulator
MTSAFHLEDALARVGAYADARRRLVLVRPGSESVRTIVFEVLAGRHDHPTAEQVHDDARERMPELLLGDVERELDELVRLGRASKPCHVGSVPRFDARTDRHHHMVCTRCERVSDLEPLALTGLQFPNARREGFEIRDYAVLFHGTCADCRMGELAREVSRQKEAYSS